MRDPNERLQDIMQAIANIERYLGRGKDAFEKDELIQTWMLHQLQISARPFAACRMTYVR